MNEGEPLQLHPTLEYEQLRRPDELLIEEDAAAGVTIIVPPPRGWNRWGLLLAMCIVLVGVTASLVHGIHKVTTEGWVHAGRIIFFGSALLLAAVAVPLRVRELQSWTLLHAAGGQLRLKHYAGTAWYDEHFSRPDIASITAFRHPRQWNFRRPASLRIVLRDLPKDPMDLFRGRAPDQLEHVAALLRRELQLEQPSLG